MPPNKGILLKGVLIPNWLNSPLASYFLIDLPFLLLHTTHRYFTLKKALFFNYQFLKLLGFYFLYLLYTSNNMITLCCNISMLEISTLRRKNPYSELFWFAFSRIWTEYGEIRSISTYSVGIQENADQNNSEYGHLLRSPNYY